MGDKTAIEWSDATWNPVTGCTKISPGCKFCYAERITERWGQDFGEIILHPDRLDQPLHWKKPRRIFVNSMSDLFHEEIPDDFIDRVFYRMCEAPQHIFQILTKRPKRMKTWIMQWLGGVLTEKMLENIWLGASCENQYWANECTAWLRTTPAVIRFLSVEPLLAPISHLPLDGIHWVICGGESGGSPERALVEQEWYSGPDDLTHSRWTPKAEALKWVRSIRDQCVAAKVPFFFKQWGGPTPKSGGWMLDGRTWDEYPQVHDTERRSA